MPALVYVDTDHNRIRYARATGAKPASASDWVTMTVDDSDTMGGEVDIVECYGLPCVTYQASASDDRYFAHAGISEPNSKADWNPHELDWNVLTVPQLAVTGSDHVAMVYKASGPSITYAEANTAAGVPPAALADWDTSVVDGDGSDFSAPQLAFIQGLPVVAYQRSASGHKELRYAYDDQVTNPNSKSASGLVINWQIATINDDDTNSGNDVELIVVNGLPVMSYRNIRIDEVLLMTRLSVPNPVNSSDWMTIDVRDETADRTDVGLQQALAWFNNRPVFLHIVSPVTATTLEITFANTEAPTGPADFTSGVLFDPPGGVYVNGQNLAMVLPDGTLMIGYRTNEGLVFAYFEAP
jgi:hypothetical protein